MLWLSLENSIEKDLNKGLLVIVDSSSLKFLYYVFEDLRGSVFRAVHSIEKSFGPNNAVNEFLGALSNRTDGKTLLFSAFSTLVALGHALFDRNTSRLVTICAGLDEWNVEIEAHRVDIVACFVVVKSIYDQVELSEKCVAEAVFLNTSNIVFNLNRRVLSTDGFLQSLTLWHVHVLSSEQELSV